MKPETVMAIGLVLYASVATLAMVSLWESAPGTLARAASVVCVFGVWFLAAAVCVDAVRKK